MPHTRSPMPLHSTPGLGPFPLGTRPCPGLSNCIAASTSSPSSLHDRFSSIQNLSHQERNMMLFLSLKKIVIKPLLRLHSAPWACSLGWWRTLLGRLSRSPVSTPSRRLSSQALPSLVTIDPHSAEASSPLKSF